MLQILSMKPLVAVQLHRLLSMTSSRPPTWPSKPGCFQLSLNEKAYQETFGQGTGCLHHALVYQAELCEEMESQTLMCRKRLTCWRTSASPFSAVQSRPWEKGWEWWFCMNELGGSTLFLIERRRKSSRFWLYLTVSSALLWHQCSSGIRQIKRKVSVTHGYFNQCFLFINCPG